MSHTRKTERAERGPMARRGEQYSEKPLPELLEELQRARAAMRLLNCISTPWHKGNAEVMKLRELSAAEIQQRRQEIFQLQSDLRAELRRRSAL